MFLVSWYIGLAYPANWLRSRPLIRYIMKIFDFFLPVGLHNIDAIKKLANKIMFSTFSRSNFKKSLSQTVIAVNFYPRKTFFKLFSASSACRANPTTKKLVGRRTCQNLHTCLFRCLLANKCMIYLQ